jgi:hypothetical protein
MDVYENILIGNFLYGLGLKMGFRATAGHSDPVCVNLLQQTPLDQPLGDVLFANPRILRVFEFKRQANTSDKEREKRSLLEDALTGPGLEHLLRISREIHWYIESDYQVVGDFTQVLPYLNFLSREGPIWELSDYIEQLANEAVNAPDDPEKTAVSKEYVKFLSWLAKSKPGGSGSLILSVTGTGALQFMHFDDLADLFLTRQQAVELWQTREMAVRPHEHAQQRARSRSSGPEMSR